MANRFNRRLAKSYARRLEREEPDRKLAAAGVVKIDYGCLSERDQNYGTSFSCYVCDTPHKALGVARIQDKSGTSYVALCDSCLVADYDDVDSPTKNAVIKKYWNAPDLEVREGGKATTVQILAVAEKQGVTEH
jgi:hypothetical protein